MKNPKINYVAVGAFVLSMAGALVVAIAVLTGRTGATDTYHTSFGDATGLKFGSQVLYMGFPVGQVESIEPVAENGRVRFEVAMSITEDFAGWGVPDDSIARISASGLLAALTIDIRAGEGATPLTPGSRLVGQERADVMAAVSDTANTLKRLTNTNVKPLLENLDRAVASLAGIIERDGAPLLQSFAVVGRHLSQRSPEIIESFLATTDEISQTSRSLRAILSPENATKVDGVLDNVLGASAELKSLTGTARGQLAALLSDDLVRAVKKAVGDIEAASGDIRGIAGAAAERAGTILSAENVAAVQAVLANLDAASVSVREAMASADRQLAMVLRDENVADVDATLDNLRSASASTLRAIDGVRDDVRHLLGPDTREKVDTALVNLSRASANVAEFSRDVNERLKDVLTPETAAKIQRALDNFASASSNVARLTADLNVSRAHLDRLLESLGTMSEENRPDVREIVLDLRHALDTVAEHVSAVTYNFEGTSRNLFEFSRQLRRNPGLLLRGGQPDDEGGG